MPSRQHFSLLTDSDLLGFGVAELQLIFRPSTVLTATPGQVYDYPAFFGYVFLFSDIKKHPDPSTKMFDVSKLYTGQLGGSPRLAKVIDLAVIERACPLVPWIHGPAKSSITPSTSLRYYDTFLINSFASHADYRSFR